MKGQNTDPVAAFWFRRDLRLDDNAGFAAALRSGLPVLPVFIFDADVFNPQDDPSGRKVSYVYRLLELLHNQLLARGSGLLVRKGNPLQIWNDLIGQFAIKQVFVNREYEPHAIARDEAIAKMLQQHDIGFFTFKDHVIAESHELVTDNGRPYGTFTPFMRRWMRQVKPNELPHYDSIALLHKVVPLPATPLPDMEALGFRQVSVVVQDPDLSSAALRRYEALRDIPAEDATTHLSIPLRYGAVSIRAVVRRAFATSALLLRELIWREFFHYILQHYPRVVTEAFQPIYDGFPYRQDDQGFAAWCHGRTGYPLVDAGMRQLLATGYMHNRVRMVAASFLTKHLLIDWRLGEAWFAKHLLDFDLANNNGNWQWAASCGVDGVPYFRIFNPVLQEKRFDPHRTYIRSWVPEIDTPDYPPVIIDHAMARQRALQAFRHHLAQCR